MNTIVDSPAEAELARLREENAALHQELAKARDQGPGRERICDLTHYIQYEIALQRLENEITLLKSMTNN